MSQALPSVPAPAPVTAQARHLVIRGRVQGVSYRQSMVREARRLGLNGWVRNCRDGTVEALISGTDEMLAAMLVWARRGPALARVDHVAVALPDPAALAELAELAKLAAQDKQGPPDQAIFTQKADHG